MAIKIDGSEGITFHDGKQQIGGTPDGLEEGTTYKRILAAFANAINDQSRLPTALGTADINLIGALTKVANLKLFVNAAGTGFDYSSGLKIIITTYDLSTASGNKVITGVGFKPSAAIILQAVNNTKMMSAGISQATSHGAIFTQDGVLADTWSYQNAKSFSAVVDGNNYVVGYVSAWDSDGATIYMDKIGSPTGTSYVTILFLR